MMESGPPGLASSGGYEKMMMKIRESTASKWLSLSLPPSIGSSSTSAPEKASENLCTISF